MPPRSSGIASPTYGLQPDPTPPPNVIYRQAASRSQSNVLVTLSITREYSTFTTVIVLGGATETPSPNPGAALTTSSSSPWPTTSTAAAPGSTSIDSAPATSTHSSSGTPTQVIVGAVLGAFFGSLLVLFLIWYCCYSPYGPRLSTLNTLYGNSGSDSSTWERKSSRATSRRRRRASETVEIRRERSYSQLRFGARPAPAPGFDRLVQREDAIHVTGQGRPGRPPSNIDLGPDDIDIMPLGRQLDRRDLRNMGR